MSGLPDIGTMMRESAKADLRGRVSKDAGGLVLRDARLRRAPQHEAVREFRRGRTNDNDHHLRAQPAPSPPHGPGPVGVDPRVLPAAHFRPYIAPTNP